VYDPTAGPLKSQSHQHAFHSYAPTAVPVITTWPPALRHVTKLGTTNPALESTVRALVTEQKANEESWWKGRETLRKEIVKKDGDESDLAVYDGKVYKACREMGEAHARRLRELGVPFFGDERKILKGEDDGDDGEGKISKDELLKLQKKMVQHLQDMYE
jgi:hypothetical protein